LDASFASDGRVTTSFSRFDSGASDIAIQTDGKIVAVGSVNTGFSSNPKPDFAIARYNPDGSLDSTFGVGGKVTTDFTHLGDNASAVAIQLDGRIVVAGSSQVSVFPLELRQFSVARYNVDGTLDLSFNPDANSDVFSTAIQADGRVVVGGQFSTMGANACSRIARLANGAATQNLTVPTSSRVEWLRGGASPEAQHVTFESSTDGGANWTALGAATRIAGGWETSGHSLSGTGQVRARARVTGGYNTGSSGLIEAVASFAFNTAPIVANSIVNQSATYGAAFSFTVPANTFSDADAGQTLSYTAGELPAWLSYDANTRTFSGR